MRYVGGRKRAFFVGFDPELPKPMQSTSALVEFICLGIERRSKRVNMGRTALESSLRRVPAPAFDVRSAVQNPLFHAVVNRYRKATTRWRRTASAVEGRCTCPIGAPELHALSLPLVTSAATTRTTAFFQLSIFQSPSETGCGIRFGGFPDTGWRNLRGTTTRACRTHRSA